MDKILKYMFFCHRLPERSFFFRGKQFPICARCTGILCGYFLGIIYVLLHKNISLILFLLLMFPIGLDGIGQLYGRWESTNIRRFITGILAGIGTVIICKAAIVLGLQSGRFVNSVLF